MMASEDAWRAEQEQAATMIQVSNTRHFLTSFLDLLLASFLLSLGCVNVHNGCVRCRPPSAAGASAAAIHIWLPRLEGAVVAIGNAPTALFHLLELLRDGAPKPAAIIGMPVGFVGAAESKQALRDNSYGVPFAIVEGRLGGSAMTAAALNALARPGI